MQDQFKQAITDAIKDGECQFTTDSLGNNYLVVIPKGRSQVDFLQLKKSISYPDAHRDTVIAGFDEIVEGFASGEK